jgi:hypothetical protein
MLSPVAIVMVAGDEPDKDFGTAALGGSET